MFTGTGTVPSACAATSNVSALANVQLGTVGTEAEWEVATACSAGDVPLGMSLEMLMVVESASVNTAMSVVLVVR